MNSSGIEGKKEQKRKDIVQKSSPYVLNLHHKGRSVCPLCESPLQLLTCTLCLNKPSSSPPVLHSYHPSLSFYPSIRQRISGRGISCKQRFKLPLLLFPPGTCVLMWLYVSTASLYPQQRRDITLRHVDKYAQAWLNIYKEGFWLETDTEM